MPGGRRLLETSRAFVPNHATMGVIIRDTNCDRSSNTKDSDERRHMKLSEAILLGSTVVAPRAGGQHFQEMQQGCALGMAAVARGCTFRTVMRPIDDPERRTLGVEGVWGTWVLLPVERPCECWRIWIRRRMRIKDVIAHLFDYHVMDKKNWTLGQLVAWVETVEPKDDPAEARLRAAVQRQAFASLELERLNHEAEEWQAVRQAFESQLTSRRKRKMAEEKNEPVRRLNAR